MHYKWLHLWKQMQRSNPTSYSSLTALFLTDTVAQMHTGEGLQGVNNSFIKQSYINFHISEQKAKIKLLTTATLLEKQREE